MAMQLLNSKETPQNFSKFKKSSNLKSFWAFLLSIFLYMSAFYLFNLSPSSLVSTTKFWFFISNTLILIIAADFSSSKGHDFYQEYTTNTTRPKSLVPLSFSPQDNKVMDHPLPYCEQEKGTEEKPVEKIVDMVEPEPVKSYEIQENTEPEPQLQLVTIKEEHDPEKPQVLETIKRRDTIVHPEGKKKSLGRKKGTSKWARSKSDKAMLSSEQNKEKRVLRRRLSERREEDKSEFWSMSNEELNKRVEEFILKCNRQIRLQAVKSRHDDFQGHNGDIQSRTNI